MNNARSVVPAGTAETSGSAAGAICAVTISRLLHRAIAIGHVALDGRQPRAVGGDVVQPRLDLSPGRRRRWWLHFRRPRRSRPPYRRGRPMNRSHASAAAAATRPPIASARGGVIACLVQRPGRRGTSRWRPRSPARACSESRCRHLFLIRVRQISDLEDHCRHVGRREHVQRRALDGMRRERHAPWNCWTSRCASCSDCSTWRICARSHGQARCRAIRR